MGLTTYLAVAGVLVVSSPLSGLAQPTPVGDEFIVNTYTTGPQRFASVCTLDGSEFVVVWNEAEQYFDPKDGRFGVIGWRYDDVAARGRLRRPASGSRR